MVRDQVRDPNAAPGVEQRVDLGAGSALEGRRRRIGRTVRCGGTPASRGEHPGGQRGKNADSQRVEHGGGDLMRLALVRLSTNEFVL
jgi:hypothetical protein